MINNVNVVFITDNNYVMQLYVTLLSMHDIKRKADYFIHIIGYKLNKKNIDILKNLEKLDFKIEVINREDLPIKDLSSKYIQFYSPALFLKLEIDKILPDCKKVLYLDSDIIVKKDLTELYSTDISKQYIGAVRDINPYIYILKNDLNTDFKYFNAGVMLLNLELIRKDNFFDKVCKDYIKNGEKYILNEQDALNNTLTPDKLKLLPPIYNWITSNGVYTTKQLNNFYETNFSKNDIAIIHYAGLKPWKDNSYFMSKDWDKYYKKSIFYDKNLKRKHKYNFFVILYIFLRNQIRILLNKKLYKKAGMI